MKDLRDVSQAEALMDSQLAQLDPSSPFDQLADRGPATTIARDLACLRVGIVNVYFAGEPDSGDRSWVLIDAGLPGSAARIRHAAEARFGEGARPTAIVLTHGHFDHVGALETLAREWDCRVYAHPLELPYLTGRAAYPPFDPTVGGGGMARMSPLFPRDPVDVSERIRVLPDDGSIPGMPGWRWLHTPGHSPGHVALFRDADRVLVAGDAVVTTKQESLTAALTQRVELHGPPAYATTDWGAARESVAALAALAPKVLATGHGRPLSGDHVADGLTLLSLDFVNLGVPRQGRYVNEAATFGADGVESVPPPVRDDFPLMVAGVGVAAIAGIGLYALSRRRARQARERMDMHDFETGLQLEAALLAGEEPLALGSAFEAEQHVPVAVEPDAEPGRDYGTRYGERHEIRPEAGGAG